MQSIRAFWVATFYCAIMLFQPGAAVAQNGPGVTEIPDPQMTLSQLRLISQGPSESIFSVEFYPRLPVSSVLTLPNERENGKTSWSVRFENARRGPSSTQQKYTGLVTGVDIVANDTDLTLTFSAKDASKLTTQPVGEGQILVTVKRVPKRASSSFGNFGGAVDNGPALPPVGSAVSYGANESYGGDDVAFEDQGAELILLKYADVSEVVGLLTEGLSVRPNNVFIRREPGFGSPGRDNGNNNNNTPPEDYDQPLGESVDRNLAIDRRLNAVWVRGSPERIARVKRQIELIDIPVDSVILETQFVELTETGARNLGLNFNNGNGQIAVGTGQLGQFVPFGLPPETFLKSAALQVALYAQIEKGNGRILSKPRIAAQSGSSAKIITGDALPIITNITLSGVNGVSEQVQYVNVGVTLQIAPRVSPDGFVTSKIYAVVSSVSGYSQGYPTISQREAETSASVRDGESFVIGGLTQESVLKSNSKIPILGDIPLVGKLFSYEKTLKGKTELYIFITPRIVNHRASLEEEPE
ncbi:type II secretion system protein GspD [Sphingorhabdus arenilitoris]|uniref:Type II secretion system protein GspD n=1 Tax=Sphingorhabdus arenilitoris TaxID=1490041 RepID=A0ABV8RFX3_9SPHN